MGLSKKYLILGAALIVVLVLVYFLGGGRQSNSSIKKNFEASRNDSLIIKKPINPTGTFLLYHLLKNYKNTSSLQKIQTSQEASLSELLPKEQKNDCKNIYFAIAEDVNLNDDDGDWLLEFVEAGNCAFIACESLSSKVRTAISDNSYFRFNNYYDTSFVLNFYHPKLLQESSIEIKNAELNSHGYPRYKSWRYFIDADLGGGFVRIAYNNARDYPICIRLQYGKGSFIIHSAPSAFSNYNMFDTGGKYHAEVIFSHLPKGNIYWHHDFGKYSPYRGIPQPTYSKQDNSDKSNYPKSSPLQYIMRVPALFTALILLMVGALLYMLFQSKRRQRIIPTIEPNENSSVEFVKTVSTLYFQQKRHDKLIKHKELIFLSFLRQHYYVSSPKITANFITKIAQKSGIEENYIKDIFITLDKGKENRNVSESELISLYNKLEYFYKNCH